MKVKNLIKILKTMSPDAIIQINIRQSAKYIDILKVYEYKTKYLGKNITKVEIVGDWKDFELDKKEYEKSEEEFKKEEQGIFEK